LKLPRGELDFRFESLPEGNREGHSHAICTRVKCGECPNSEASRATSGHRDSFEFRHGLTHRGQTRLPRGGMDPCAQTSLGGTSRFESHRARPTFHRPSNHPPRSTAQGLLRAS
jgi:hypothetical protein